jgi:CDP-4-dehydro-6-deoxyglucose reductase, E1
MGSHAEKTKIAKALKQDILAKVGEYYRLVHCGQEEFIPGKSRINYAGRVFDEKEMINLTDSSLKFWLTYGRYSKEFEKKLAEFLGVKYTFLVNSGSSANLLAFMALTSPLLGDPRIKRGDEVITVAAGFPTTVAPIIQYGAIPVFVDVDLETFNIDVTQLEKSVSSKTRAVMLAHTLGNPFDIQAVKTFCQKHNLWLIEDNCDALGSQYMSEEFWPASNQNSKPKTRPSGTFGDIGTSSFYPPHHMTMGEGGAVYTNNKLLKKIILSIRDWGRDCWCESGRDNTCGCRFSKQYGTLPFGYDHKYVYSHFGYNLKATDMQAAIGCAQLEKLPDFIQKRKDNFQYLYNGLKDLKDIFILPKATPQSDPCWFGFLLTLKDGVPFKRNDIVKYLEDNNIQTRNLFAGNISRHPCFSELESGQDYRIISELKNTDKIMKDSFWVGVYPGMRRGALEYMVDCIKGYQNI